ncbi:unnamed protein product [Clavelina lepadiformis]|uniref:Uncharacterized protein n=1 Tax=Clavelina lepadiformis TaxID=159417 RepID=A0ABP0G738_CLALP
MTNSLVNFIVYRAREGEFWNEIVNIFRPGYLRQLKVQDMVPNSRNDENSSQQMHSSVKVIETNTTSLSKET